MPEPRYRQIADDLRNRIESGDIGQGDQLPTELELRQHYAASRNTVRDAVKLLIARRLVVTRPGQGTFVVDRIDPIVTRLSTETGYGNGDETIYSSAAQTGERRLSASAPRVEIHQARGVIAAELGLPEGDPVVSRHQQRYIDQIPWSLQTAFYPMRYFEAGARRLLEAADMPKGAVRYLEETLDVKQVGWRDVITVRTPDVTETAFFKLPEDGRVAVFEIRRTAFERSGPLRLSVTVYPSDRNQFIMESGEIPPQ